jgi:hypothetical protein
MGALAAELTAAERGLDADCGPQAGAEVDRADPKSCGGTVGMAGDAHDAGVGLEHRVIAGPIALGAVVPVPGDRAVDQTVVARA